METAHTIVVGSEADGLAFPIAAYSIFENSIIDKRKCGRLPGNHFPFVISIRVFYKAHFQFQKPIDVYPLRHFSRSVCFVSPITDVHNNGIVLSENSRPPIANRLQFHRNGAIPV